MVVYELKKIVLKSLFKCVPLVFSIVGVVIGIFTFFLFPADVAANLSFGPRILAFLLFVVLYSLLMVVGAVIISMIYNMISNSTGGVIFQIEEKAE